MGGRSGLGSKDGRSCGGAVSFFTVARRRQRIGLVSVVMMAFALACARQNTPPPPDAATLLQGVAAADPAKYPEGSLQETRLRETRHWSNPYLVIRPEAVGLLTSITANEEQILKPEDVLNALARLPASAWPYGRAVAILVDEKPTASEADKIALRRNRGIVAGDLEGAQVAINWISTP
jgi:hypothetical protein